MQISVSNQQKKINLDDGQIKKLIQLILTYEKISDATLNFIFISSQKMRAMNIQYKERYETTDVLAFDFSEGLPEKSKIKKNLFGDIFISTHAACQNSHQYQTPLAQELILYVVHGILHLLGYDDHSPKDVQRMREKEQEILAFLGKKVNRSVIQP